MQITALLLLFMRLKQRDGVILAFVCPHYDAPLQPSQGLWNELHHVAPFRLFHSTRNGVEELFVRIFGRNIGGKHLAFFFSEFTAESSNGIR